ncbi:MAG: transcription elongation factor GreB [Gammaproteobacteria bacterium]|nr:transcription elongation factor GreB [Gammaproteobacteria bacterium]
MTRYRPPQPKSSPYITPAGYLKLQQELKALWRRRADVTRALTAAAAEGDRSENAEYIYRKKELRGIDRRIRYLQKRLPELNVVRQPPTDQQRIFFGATVTLESASGEELSYRIVGPDEFDAGSGRISIDAPLARAMLKKTLDDEVKVRSADNHACYYVVAIDYL